MTYFLDYKNLSDTDYAFFKKLASEKLRKPSMVARCLLSYVLYADYGISEYSIITDKRGKPFLENSDLFISISHSGNFALVSVSDKLIGCDVQKMTEYNPRIASRFYAENEFEVLEKTDNKDMLFTVMWTLKEAVLKKSGEGITGGLSEFDFSQVSDKESFNLYGDYFTVKKSQDFSVAVCSEEKEEIIKQIDLQLLIDYVKTKSLKGD